VTDIKTDFHAFTLSISNTFKSLEMKSWNGNIINFSWDINSVLKGGREREREIERERERKGESLFNASLLCILPIPLFSLDTNKYYCFDTQVKDSASPSIKLRAIAQGGKLTW
jgi:hypothetical protein